jgi:hypothetical protein
MIEHQGGGTVESLTPEPEKGADVFLLDCAPDNGGPPSKSIALRSYAEEMVAADSTRFRIVSENEAEPLERSDGRPIVNQVTDQ